jgi:hypothetical protein
VGTKGNYGSGTSGCFPSWVYLASNVGSAILENSVALCSSGIWSYRDVICGSGTGPFGARRELQRGSAAVAFLDSCGNIIFARLDAAE